MIPVNQEEKPVSLNQFNEAIFTQKSIGPIGIVEHQSCSAALSSA